MDILSACDAKIAPRERESTLLDELFHALLEELMTGRVAVTGGLDHEAAKDREGAKHERAKRGLPLDTVNREAEAMGTLFAVFALRVLRGFRVFVIHTLLAALERESTLLDELFRALLEELMTGRVAVTGGLDHEAAKDREGAEHERAKRGLPLDTVNREAEAMGTLFAVFVLRVLRDLRVFVIHTPLAPRERESTLLDELFRASREELMTGRVAVAGGGLDHEAAEDREGARHEAGEARLAARHSEPLS